MTRIRDIVHYLEQIAPLAYQEEYDNAGLIIGDASALVQGVLICLDVTESLLQEAKTKSCNLVVAHHPVIFRAIHRLTGKDYTERCIIYAVKHGIAIYVLHTNFDNVSQGINRHIAYTLGLTNVSVLSPKPDTLSQLTVFVPHASVDPVLQALHEAGAGSMGDDPHCHFVTTGIRSVQPTPAAQPYLRSANHLEKVREERVEVMFPSHLETAVLHALRASHPYEEMVHYIQPLKNTNTRVGAGMIGELAPGQCSASFLAYLKVKMCLSCIRHTAPLTRSIQRVAVCGGSGSALIRAAISKQADALVTADIKYHHFFEAEDQILIADVGHYESEIGIKMQLYALLSKKFASIALLQCETTTNPVHYF